MSILRLGAALLAAVGPVWAQCQGRAGLFSPVEVRDLGTIPVGQRTEVPAEILFTAQSGDVVFTVKEIGPVRFLGFDRDPPYPIRVEQRASLRQGVPQQRPVNFIATLALTLLEAGPQTFSIEYNLERDEVPCQNPAASNFVAIGEGALTPTTFWQNLQSGSWSEPVSTATGELFGHDDAIELNLGGPLPLFVQRYYASYLEANGVRGALGRNWRHNFEIGLAIEGATATITGFRGKTVEFRLENGNWGLSGVERLTFQLIEDPDGGFRFLDRRDGLIYSFGAQGRLTQIADRNGNALEVAQGPNGPTSVADGLGRSLNFAYDGASLSMVSDSAGRSVMFEQSGGNLTAWTDANGRRWTYAYTEAGELEGLITAETRPIGNRPFNQVFDDEGRVASQADSRGNAMALEYKPEINGATISEPNNVSLTHEHDDQFNLVSQTDPSGGSSAYAYDANGRLTSITDRTGAVSQIAWDEASGLPSSTTDQLGNVTNYTYAAVEQDGFIHHDLTQIAYPDGATVSLERDDRGNPIALTDQAGARWEVTRNERGQPLAVTNPEGGVATFEYDPDGTLSSTTNPVGDTQRFRPDAAGNLATLTQPDGSTRTYRYDARDNPLEIVNELGNRTVFALNDNNSPLSVADPSGATATAGYDPDDRVVESTDRLGNVAERAFDESSRVASVSAPEGERITIAYDTLNRAETATDSTGGGVEFQWDDESRLTGLTDSLGRTTAFTRNARGDIASATTPNGETFRFVYDAVGRPVSEEDPLGRTRQITYSLRGLVSRIAFPESIEASYARNGLGQVTRVTDPLGGEWNRMFDNAGRLTASTDPLGRTRTYEYDSRQRLARAAADDVSVTLDYDAVSNLTRQSFSDGTVLDYAYDSNNRLVAANGLTLAYDAGGRIIGSNGLQLSRDRNGRVATVTYGEGKVVSYGYDARGFPETISDWVGGETRFSYNQAGDLTSTTFPNGVVESYTYDQNGLPATIKTTRGETELASITLERDAAGQIVRAERSTPASLVSPAGVRSLSYDAAHQIAGADYDVLGRLTNDSLRTYTWDPASNLTSYSGTDGMASFTYDALGQRLSRSSSGSTETYILNYGVPLPVVAAVLENDVPTAYYVWAPNGSLMHRIDADGDRRFYHFDEAGSTSFLSDDAGNVTDSYAISPYGETVRHSGSTDNPFTFQGQLGVIEEGSTGLFYHRLRYFDSTSARFLSRDPVVLVGPQTVNPYQYALESPIEGTDPSGATPARRVGRRHTVLEDDQDLFFFPTRALEYVKLIGLDLALEGGDSSFVRSPELGLLFGSQVLGFGITTGRKPDPLRSQSLAAYLSGAPGPSVGREFRPDPDFDTTNQFDETASFIANQINDLDQRGFESNCRLLQRTIAGVGSPCGEIDDALSLLDMRLRTARSFGNFVSLELGTHGFSAFNPQESLEIKPIPAGVLTIPVRFSSQDGFKIGGLLTF